MRNLDIPKEPAKKRAWILYQLSLRGLSFAAIGRQIGLTKEAVRAATVKPYPKMERILAKAIECAPQEIWPERYDASGRPLSGRGERGIGRHPSRLKGSKSNNNTPARRRNVNQPGAR